MVSRVQFNDFFYNLIVPAGEVRSNFYSVLNFPTILSCCRVPSERLGKERLIRMPDVEAAAPTKKRGRPSKGPKEPADASAESGEPVVKKGRGRPPKGPKEPADASAETGEPVVKRGRGRPKGSKSAKKKEAATGPKRPRGRPKGSVKKNPAEEKPATPKKSPKKPSE